MQKTLVVAYLESIKQIISTEVGTLSREYRRRLATLLTACFDASVCDDDFADELEALEDSSSGSCASESDGGGDFYHVIHQCYRNMCDPFVAQLEASSMRDLAAFTEEIVSCTNGQTADSGLRAIIEHIQLDLASPGGLSPTTKLRAIRFLTQLLVRSRAKMQPGHSSKLSPMQVKMASTDGLNITPLIITLVSGGDDLLASEGLKLGTMLLERGNPLAQAALHTSLMACEGEFLGKIVEHLHTGVKVMRERKREEQFLAENTLGTHRDVTAYLSVLH